MKLSISHIAWPASDEDSYLKYIKEWGCEGVEVAPTRLWPNPAEATREQRRNFREKVHGFGLEIVALHALLFQRDDLGLFRDSTTEIKTIEYLKRLCELAKDLGTKVLVVGSPANRRRGNIPFAEALERAVEFFTPIARYAVQLGVCLCIEPLKPEETDFITTVQEGHKLIEMIDSPGFGLHLDAKAVNAQGENFEDILRPVIKCVKHFHINNDAKLSELNTSPEVDHVGLAEALRKLHYNRYVNIEMRTSEDHHQSVRRSIEFARNIYLKEKLLTIKSGK